ncbi:hypothetical protein XTPLMG728_2953 [Xanthomonas translucens pv. poae]|uniref:Uncharacterized protein n=1 Tax=Xanthomonas graminis pv. poae TaxID=227946 RepID=A0A0K3A7Y9_9XANT|nr:hypothetical protein [Xanthomonas translucens]UKE62488.1 hypothetical protein KM539_02820 [Xanthomonas translucens pv. poae]CTP91595.1 hypothetical protein XTPLMG728_2953 [Xanthomonas translucens pv. poae]
MSNNFVDVEWGCEHSSMLGNDELSIICCKVSVTDIAMLAEKLAATVIDTSWMADLDLGTRRAYEYTVAETSQALCKIFSGASLNSTVAEEFGEVMVSMGSARALKSLFGHSEVPLAELWKPQLKQNEGFDFHTVCGSGMLNFGEAKYSGVGSPHGPAINQASDFIVAKKHLRDYVHLSSLCPAPAELLNSDKFGVIAAFSLVGNNHDLIMKNALKSALGLSKKHKLSQIFLVGVSNDA